MQSGSGKPGVATTPVPRCPHRMHAQTVQTRHALNWTISDDFLLISDNVQFIETAYLQLLRRPADALGIQHYLEKLKEGYGQMFVLAALRTSPEGRKAHARVAGFSVPPGFTLPALPGSASDWQRPLACLARRIAPGATCSWQLRGV
ncbi:MAG: DUF4214 domain-containing protein [Rhodoferax sp.]|nr:DUF4214 domain-containing protein [Rhodoferax sp.]